MSPGDTTPDPAELAESRLRAEMARQRRQEQAQIKALRAGCFIVIFLILLGMAVVFFL